MKIDEITNLRLTKVPTLGLFGVFLLLAFCLLITSCSERNEIDKAWYDQIINGVENKSMLDSFTNSSLIDLENNYTFFKDWIDGEIFMPIRFEEANHLDQYLEKNKLSIEDAGFYVLAELNDHLNNRSSSYCTKYLFAKELKYKDIKIKEFNEKESERKYEHMAIANNVPVGTKIEFSVPYFDQIEPKPSAYLIKKFEEDSVTRETFNIKGEVVDLFRPFNLTFPSYYWIKILSADTESGSFILYGEERNAGDTIEIDMTRFARKFKRIQ